MPGLFLAGADYSGAAGRCSRCCARTWHQAYLDARTVAATLSPG